MSSHARLGWVLPFQFPPNHILSGKKGITVQTQSHFLRNYCQTDTNCTSTISSPIHQPYPERNNISRHPIQTASFASLPTSPVMWVEILCGLIVYKLFRRFFAEGDDGLEVESSVTNALFHAATRLEKLYGGKAYVGLRLPDADTGSRQNIDMVLVTKGEAVVICVKNFSGFVSITGDGTWVCEGGEGRHKSERHPDPVEEAKKQASVLESYLDQRGIGLPEGYLSYKVLLPNPKFRTIHSNYFPPEVITYDQWVELKPEPKSMFSGWIKGAFRGGKKEMQESFHQQLNFALSTAPMWDRVELKNNKYVLGEFLEFKGKQEDITALRNIKRSKVSRLIIQKTSMFGLAHSKLQVLYCPRDYRSEGASGSEWKEATVRSSTEVLFQPENSGKVRKFKLSSIISMSLSA